MIIDLLENTISEELTNELTQANPQGLSWQCSSPANVSLLQLLLQTIWTYFIIMLSEKTVQLSVIQAWKIEFDSDYKVSEDRTTYVGFESELDDIVKLIENLRVVFRDCQGDISNRMSDFLTVVWTICQHFYEHLSMLSRRENSILYPGANG